jgi:hypothetical protein
MLVVLASVLLCLLTLVGYARRAAFNSGQFANRATQSLQDPAVRTILAERVTDGLVLRADPDLLAARPLIAGIASGIVGSAPFGALFHASVLDVHRAVFQHDENTVTLTLSDVGTVIGAAMQQLRPKVAGELERRGRIVVVKRDVGSATGDLARAARDARLASWVLAGLLLAAVVGAVALSADRRRIVSQLGLGFAAVGVLILVGLAIARALVVGSVAGAENRAAAGAIWDVFFGDLRTWGWLIAGSGAVLAAAAASLIHPMSVEGPVRAAWRIVTTDPARTPLRLLRAGLLIAAGALVIANPLTALQVAAMLVGVYLVYCGVEVVLRVIYRPPAPDAEPEPAAAPRRLRTRRLAVGGIAAALVGGGVAIAAGSGATTAPAVGLGSCEGHVQLCDKPLDEVVLPATHNAMSVPLPGWYSAEQERPIAAQLRDGIRGLLIDTHYGDLLPDGRVRTVFETPEDINASIKQDALSPQTVDAARRLRERLGFRGEGKRGMYLCHTFCELGATPLEPVLRDIHDFLVTHPSEVVVIINQDYISPQDIVKAFGDAGLASYALTPPSSGAWPTLRQMIERNQRLVVLAENHAGAAPWYQPVYQRVTEETPFTFRSASLLTTPADLPASCKRNRGPPSAPLFLINHWVSTDPVPRPSDAAKVNAFDPLLARARECERLRHHLPTLLAVNFYLEGDVFKVVDVLNGVA